MLSCVCCPLLCCHPCSEAKYGAILGPYLDDPANVFIVSSDFCHWGRRFSYTHYNEEQVRGRSVHSV